MVIYKIGNGEGIQWMRCWYTSGRKDYQGKRKRGARGKIGGIKVFW